MPQQSTAIPLAFQVTSTQNAICFIQPLRRHDDDAGATTLPLKTLKAKHDNMRALRRRTAFGGLFRLQVSPHLLRPPAQDAAARREVSSRFDIASASISR